MCLQLMVAVSLLPERACEDYNTLPYGHDEELRCSGFLLTPTPAQIHFDNGKPRDSCDPVSWILLNSRHLNIL